MKKSKSLIVLTALLGLLLSCAVGFTACGETEHTHELEHVAAQGASCETAGNVEYWTCSECGKYFSDEQGENEITASETVIPASHMLSEVKRVDPDCETAGSRAYFECSVCDKKFTDENATDEIADITLPALGHDYALRVDVAAGTYMPDSYLTADKLTYTLFCTKDDIAEQTLTDGVVCDLSAPLVRGENTFTASYEQGDVKAEGQFTVTTTDDSAWKEFPFDAVQDGGYADGFTLTGGGGIEGDHIGNVSQALGLKMTFSVESDGATEASLYLMTGERITPHTFNQVYKLTVNGEEVESTVAMPSKGQDIWGEFQPVLIAFIQLTAEQNKIVIEVIDGNDAFGCNVKGIVLKTKSDVTLTPYVEPVHGGQWTEYEFNAINGSTLADGFYTSGNALLNSNAGGYIGNLSGEKGSRLTLFITSDKATEAVLYLSICSRAMAYTFDDEFTLTVNGVEVSSDAAMPGGGDNWETFTYVRVGDITLVEGKNTIVFEIASTEGGIGGNIHGVKFGSKEGVLTAYVPGDFNDSTWHETDYAAIKDGAYADGFTATGGWNNSNYLGNLSGDSAKGIKLTFTVTASGNTQAGLYFAVCSRSQSYCFFDEFKLTVNGKEVESYAKMPTGGDYWESFTYVKIALVDLEAGANEIVFEIISGNGAWGGNVSGIRLTTEEEGVLTPQAATASYVAELPRKEI